VSFYEGDPMKCPYCNAEIEDGSKFCTNCGKSLADSDLEGLGDEPPRKSMEKAMRILVIGASVIATVIIAITLGVRSFISREYQKGVSAYENQDYESAINALKHAVRWGHNEQAQALLAHSYYRLGKLDEAYTAYETVYATMSDDEEVLAGYADTCEKLAYRCISENNAEQAVVYLKKEYELTEDERVSRRIKAIEGGGNFADEHGNVYNLAGQLETAVCYDESGKELYHAELVYGPEGQWQFAKASLPGAAKKTVFGTFDWNEAGELELSVYPQGNEFSWISEKREYNSDSRVKRITSLSEVSKHIMTFEYSHNSKGFLEKEKITSSNGETMELEWSGVEYPDHAVISFNDEQYIAVLSYNSDGKIETLTITKNLVQTVYKMVNLYGADGSLQETTVKNSGMPMTLWKPYGSYSKTVTEYSAHQPVSRTVYNEAGQVTARGYYVDGCGWLMMYTGE